MIVTVWNKMMTEDETEIQIHYVTSVDFYNGHIKLYRNGGSEDVEIADIPIGEVIGIEEED